MGAKQLAVIDAETDPFKRNRIPKPFLWGFTDDGATVKYFDHLKELLRYIAGKSLLVYAHNGGRFDYHLGFLPYLEELSQVTIINGRLARFMIGDNEFRDSVNILPIQLKEFDKDEIDYAKLERKVRRKHMPEIRKYLAKDCTSLWTLVHNFHERYGRGLTLAGSAMKTWRKMTGEDNPANDDADFFASMRPYYYGGRVQCFARGIVKKPFNVVDINSAYPFAMLHDHPFTRAYDEYEDTPPKSPIDVQGLYTVDASSRGGLPYRDAAGRLSFPNDAERRLYHITGWELAAAKATRTVRIHAIPRRIAFGKVDSFSAYIRHFYELKQKAEKGTPEYLFAKLFMNSLYGKFGANPDNYTAYGIAPHRMAKQLELDPEPITMGKHTGRWSIAGHLGPWALMESELSDAERFFYNLATAASITGFVRALLWRHACRVVERGGKLLYCDTDSLAFQGELGTFKLSKELGDWSHEGRFDLAAIAGKKLYAFRGAKACPISKGEWKTASKGVRLTPAEIVSVAKGETVRWQNDKYTFGPRDVPKQIIRDVRATI